MLLLFNLRVNCKAQVTAIMGTREFGCWVDNVYSAVSVYLMPKTANRNTLNCENSCFFSFVPLTKKKKSKTEFSVENKAACSKVALPDSKGEKKEEKEREAGRPMETRTK